MNAKTPDQTLGEQARAGAHTSLGERLRSAREARGISLREISDQTRISMRYLEAIEANDYKHLPGGIFNKSFIKSYARYIKFSEDEALEAYARLAREHGETAEEVNLTPKRSRIYTDGDVGRSPLITWALSLIILGILTLGIYAALHWYRRSETQPANNDPTANRQQAPQQPGAQQQAATTSAANTANFNVQVRAKGEPVWLRVRVDESAPTDFTLAADETKEYQPSSRLSLGYSRSKAAALEVSINGRAVRIPTEAKGGLVELNIPKEGFETLLQ